MTPAARIFAATDFSPSPRDLLREFQAKHPTATFTVEEDDQGWFSCRLQVGDATYVVDRFLREEDGIVGQLQGWAAWVESRSTSAAHERLTALLATARQVFVIHRSSADGHGVDDEDEI